MKWLSILLLSGCTSVGSGYQPRTLEGAQCKQRCASEMSACMSMPVSCRSAANTCMESCQEVEQMKAK